MSTTSSHDLPDLVHVVRQYLRRPAWMAQAACRGMDTALFFPSRGNPAAAAKAVCASCPVAAWCLAYAQEGGVDGMPLVGVWAGTSERERRALRRVSDRRAG